VIDIVGSWQARGELRRIIGVFNLNPSFVYCKSGCSIYFQITNAGVFTQCAKTAVRHNMSLKMFFTRTKKVLFGLQKKFVMYVSRNSVMSCVSR